jgi:hypothetical protein
MTSYVFSGEFRFLGKLKQSFKENILFYAIGLVVCLILFVIIFLIYKADNDLGDYDTLFIIIHGLKSAGNMFGLLMLVCLLGYGFVFVPRDYWRMYNTILFILASSRCM